MHHVALDRAGPHDGNLDDQIIERGRLQPWQHRHLGAAFNLEQPETVGPLQHAIDGRILGRQRGDRQIAPVIRAQQIEAFLQARQHAQRQHVHFEYAQRIEVVLVPFDDGAIHHRGILDRHQFVEAAARHHEPADVLRQVTRKPLYLACKFEHSSDRGCLPVDARTLGINFPDAFRAKAPDRARQRVQRIL